MGNIKIHFLGPMLLLLLLHKAKGGIVEPKNECYANDANPYLMFATKTSYFTVDDEDDAPIQIEGGIVLKMLKVGPLVRGIEL